MLVGASPETKAAVHALVGGLMSEALGGGFAAGAAGGAAASLAMEAFGKSLLDQKDLSESHRKALVQLAGAIVGGAAGAAVGGSVYDAAAGAYVGKVATENNYLNHIQKRDRAEAIAAFKDDACRKQVQDEYAAEWEKNRAKVENCSSHAECFAVAQSLRAEQQEQGQRIGSEGKSERTMQYRDPVEIPKADIDRMLESSVPEATADACLSIAYFEVDWEWALTRLSGVAFDLDHPDSLRNLAVTCIGHLVRRNRAVDVAMAEQLLLRLAADRTVAGAASDALDDLHIFGVLNAKNDDS